LAGKPDAFIRRLQGHDQSQPPMAELGFEHAIFLDQIRDHLLLVTLHPTGYHGDEHLQNHGLSSGWKL
jgi:hypothetical protein